MVKRKRTMQQKECYCRHSELICSIVIYFKFKYSPPSTNFSVRHTLLNLHVTHIVIAPHTFASRSRACALAPHVRVRRIYLSIQNSLKGKPSQ